ncbi:MAG TPA: PQQ-binding-like beta-propeller repeat protein [Rhizomicrobium sp.]
MKMVRKAVLGGTALALLATAAFGADTGWTTSGHDLGGQRYSPLTQITKDNVANLGVAWTYHLTPAGYTGRPRLVEVIPIVAGNSMYIASTYGEIIALNATTGAELWKFTMPDNDTPSARGLAWWGGAKGAPATVVFGSRLGRLYSLDAKTGKPVEGFGDHGIVNLKTPEVMQTGPQAIYNLPTPPIVYKNLIITGAGTPDAGPNRGPRGDTRAWDAKTGKLVWTFHTVPLPGTFGADTWGGDGARNRSGVNVWGYMTVDAQRGILYMPLGAPNNDRVGVDRPGDNLFGSSLVAVDANTGKYLWHFQVVHHDIWDYDTQDPPVLMDVRKDGKTIPAVLTVNKNALAFILDRVTGKPIFGVEERAVPQSKVPGEQTSPTQPFPVKPEPLAQNTLSRDNLYKGEPSHQSYCEKLVDDKHMVLGGPFLPPGYNEITVSPPGTQGGVNFYGGSYDPKLHLFVANVNNLFQPMHVVKKPDGSFVNDYGVLRFWDPEKKLPCGPTPWGQLVAVNVDTGAVAWRKTLGVTEEFPAGLQDTGRPGLGGTILTASGLTFVGATDDFRFRAFATATGDKLWEVKLKASVTATPVTYKGADGRQFVAALDTGGSQTGSVVTNDEVVAFALPHK